MEKFTALLAIWGESPRHWWIFFTKCQQFGAVATLISCWTNSRIAGKLRRRDDHVTSLGCQQMPTDTFYSNIIMVCYMTLYPV